MVNPQTENGYTAVANEIFEQMAKIKLSPTQYRLIFIIWRYTYGFKRKEHNFSLSFFADSTGCDKRQIQRELKELCDRSIILQSSSGKNGRLISFNKHYDQWVDETTNALIGETDDGEMDNGDSTNGNSANGDSANGDSAIGETVNTTIGETTNSTIGETTNQEINILNKNINKNNIVHEHENFFESIWRLYPNKKGKGKISDSHKSKLCKIGIDEITRAIKRYSDYVERQRLNGFSGLNYQNGSTFFNSGYVDYLDKNYEEEKSQYSCECYPSNNGPQDIIRAPDSFWKTNGGYDE